jgi:GNAT superfamily N-acetyltransferase
MDASIPLSIRPVSSGALTALVPALAELLSATVNGGASLGFVPPMSADEARDYWRSLRPELQAGRRLVFGAFHDDRIVGSGQLALPAWPNAKHRAEVQKLFVDASLQGQGIGRLIMAALHAAALDQGRSLVMLNARHGGSAERFYRALGYRVAGVIPGYMVGPDRTRIDSVTMYQEIGEASGSGGYLPSTTSARVYTNRPL